MAELTPMKLSNMTAAQSIDLGDLMYLTVEDELSETGYYSRKITAQNLAASLLGNFSFPLLLDKTTAHSAIGAINELASTRRLYVGTCSTAAATAQKEVTVSAAQNFTLEVGTTICVKFSVSNSATDVTISVNGTTAYPIWFSNSQYSGSSAGVTGQQNCNLTYVFDGSYWCWLSMGKYQSYSSMTDAEAEAGTSTSNRVISPSVLKHAIQYHAIPQVDGNERVVGKLGNDTLYEQLFYYDFSDIDGGTQSDTVINGRFDLPHINYGSMWIEAACLINDVPDGTFTIKSLPLPSIQNNNGYVQTQIQKTTSNDGYPFIYLDVNWSVSQIWAKRNDIHFMFTLRYTKAS